MVQITSINFYDEYTGQSGGGTPYLLGSVGDKITAIIEIAIFWNHQSGKYPLIFTSASKTIQRQDNGSFISDGFRVGDNITISGTASNDGNKTIASVTTGIITINEAVTTETKANVIIYGTTPIKGLDFYTNLVENRNGEDFHSLVDAQTNCKFNAGGLDATATMAPPQVFTIATNSKGWVTYSANTTIVAKGITGDHKQTFEIVHVFDITPFFLNWQLNNLELGLPPAPGYFQDNKSLKYIYRFDAKFDNLNPTITHTSDPQDFNFGNTAWFNEFLNGFDPEYTLTSITYTDVATSLTVNQIDPTKTIDVEIDIFSKSGNFSNAVGYYPGSPVVLNIAYLPNNSNQYINTNTTLDYNFLHDRKLVTIGVGSVNGDNFGLDLQQLTIIQAQYTNANNAKVKFRYNASTYIKNAISGFDVNNRNYLIWVTPQKKVSNTIDLDRNAVICDVNTYDINLDDPTLFQIINYTKFYEYPDVGVMPFTDFKGFITDQVLSRTEFFLNPNTVLKSLSIRIEASDGTNSFLLQRQDFDLSNTYNQNLISQVDQSIEQGYNIPDGERNLAILQRVPSLDVAPQKAYELLYGFKLRYEDWRQILTYDPTFVNNHTEDWSVYSNQAGWGVLYNIYASVLDPATGHTTDFIHQCNLSIFPSGYYTAPISLKIETFTEDGLINLNGNIQNDANTMVKATFTGDFSSTPIGYDDFYGILYLDTIPTGGFKSIDQCSTVEAPVNNSKWISQASLNKISNSEIEIIGVLSSQQFDKQIKQYVTGARLGYFADADLKYRVLEDGISPRVLETDELRLME